MGCHHCVTAVESALRSVKGVENASVSLENGTVHVAYDDHTATTAQMQKAVKDAGYELLTGEE